jgi:iron-sulfur cluster assembly protein
MALDEPKQGDQVFEDGGIKFLIDKQLFDQAKPIRIDFLASKRRSGFSVSGNLSAGGRC